MKLTAYERVPVQHHWHIRKHGLIESPEQLMCMKPRFVRTLSNELSVRALTGRVSPVLFEDGRAGVFALAEYCHDDQTQALLGLIESKGYSLSEPSLFVVASALLVTIDRARPVESLSAPASSSDIPVQRSALSDVFKEIICWAVRHDASDIHFNVYRLKQESAVFFTIGGRYLCPERYRHITTATLLDMLSVAWMSVQGGNGAVFDPMIEQQGRLSLPVAGRAIALRWASLATDAGPSVCLRLLTSAQLTLTPDLVQLGYLDSQIRALNRARALQGGAVVLAGSVGSGKSTTIATLMRDIPADRKVITLEDPVEYLIPNALQNTVCRTLDDSDGYSFDTKLKTIKRSAMNDLLIGEIRDATGGRALMDLAGCGVNLYTTVHAGSVLLIPDRLASSFIGVARDLMATPGILKLLVYQLLIPRLCPDCSVSVDQVFEEGLWEDAEGVARHFSWFENWIACIESAMGTNRSCLRFRSSEGCERCRYQAALSLPGTRGRTVVAEMIEPACEPDFLDGIKRGDGLGLHKWFHGRKCTALNDPDMSGKSVMKAAMYKMICGEIDPRELEIRFGMFADATPGFSARV